MSGADPLICFFYHRELKAGKTLCGNRVWK